MLISTWQSARVMASKRVRNHPLHPCRFAEAAHASEASASTKFRHPREEARGLYGLRGELSTDAMCGSLRHIFVGPDVDCAFSRSNPCRGILVGVGAGSRISGR